MSFQYIIYFKPKIRANTTFCHSKSRKYKRISINFFDLSLFLLFLIYQRHLLKTFLLKFNLI